MVECARQLNVKRAGRSEEIRMVTEREQERRAIELGDWDSAARVPGGPGHATVRLSPSRPFPP
jgi:hypothetical protein